MLWVLITVRIPSSMLIRICTISMQLIINYILCHGLHFRNLKTPYLVPRSLPNGAKRRENQIIQILLTCVGVVAGTACVGVVA